MFALSASIGCQLRPNKSMRWNEEEEGLLQVLVLQEFESVGEAVEVIHTMFTAFHTAHLLGSCLFVRSKEAIRTRYRAIRRLVR